MKIILASCIALMMGMSGFSQNTKLEESKKRGSEIYADFCMNCHMPNGEGVKGEFPPLAKSDFLIKNRTKSIKALKYGLKGEIIVNGVKYNGFMAPLGLSEDEVADVMNYITNSWGNKNKKMITEEEVAKVAKK
jgi:mono/diheme cytochrome c family protein